jgi:hypothetical protein
MMTPETDSKAAPATDPPKVQEKEKPKAQAMPAKMTVDQYLRRSPQGNGIDGLIRSLNRTKIMSFAEWEATVKNLRKKQVR